MRPFESQNVKLKDATGVWKEATLSEGITGRELDQLTETWSPLLRKANAEDAGWNWKKLKEDVLKCQGVYKLFAITVDGELEGVMRLILTARTRNDPALHLVYVDRLIVAPWNRPWTIPRKYRPVGRTLLAQAVAESVGQEFYGRIGLHSLPGAVSWYRELKMTSHGPNPAYDDLHYFEFEDRQAVEFLGEEATLQLREMGYPLWTPNAE